MTDKDLYKKTEGILYNYETIKLERENIKIEIQEIKSEYKGCGAIQYNEKTGPTNKFNSSVENEVLKKKEIIDKLEAELERKNRIISKVDNALRTLEEFKRKIIELRYFKRCGWDKIGVILKLDKDYCGKKRVESVKKIAPLIWVKEKVLKKY